MTTEEILDYPVSQMGLQSCLDEICSWVHDPGPARYFACANPHSLVVARHDPQFRQALLNADLIVPDGVGILLASRLLGGDIHARVTGTDLFLGINQALSATPAGRCFFLGSTPDTLEKIRLRMKERFPLMEVVGCYSPPFVPEFDAEENERILRAIHAARPSVLWVGLTAPKQEKWIHAHIHRLEVPIVGPIGAVFDFFSGQVHRSNPIFQRLGLEWLPRLLRNPRHLWKRTLISAPVFLWLVMRQKWVVAFMR